MLRCIKFLLAVLGFLLTSPNAFTDENNQATLHRLPVYGPMHLQVSTVDFSGTASHPNLDIAFPRAGGTASFFIHNSNVHAPAFCSYRLTVKLGAGQIIAPNYTREFLKGEHMLWFPLSDKNEINLIQIQALAKDTKVQVQRLQAHQVLPADNQISGQKQFTNKPFKPFLTSALPFPNAGFEEGTLQPWRAEGEAFSNQPTYDDNAFLRLTNTGAFPAGDYWIGTYENHPSHLSPPKKSQNDGPQGTLISPEFTVNHRFLSGLLGGGRQAATAVVIMIDGQEAARFTGMDAEVMRPFVMDLSEYRGLSCRIRIIDHESGVWGHINADNFRVFGTFDQN